MIRQAISCDICGSEKKQTNHWFVAYDQGGELRISGWNSRNRLKLGSKHLCGQTCLHKLVDEFMAKTLALRPPHAIAEADDGLVDLEKYTISERVNERLAERAPAPSERLTDRPFERMVERTLARQSEPRKMRNSQTDASLTSSGAYTGEGVILERDEFDSSARLIPHPSTVTVQTTTIEAPVVTADGNISSARKTVELVAMAAKAHLEEGTVLVDEARFNSRNWRAEAWEREREREMRSVERHATGTLRRRRSGS